MAASVTSAARPVPGIIKIAYGQHTDITGHVSTMMENTARHCRCRVRHYAEYNHEEHQYYAKVYGYESDLRYFEILYTTLHLHMLGALLPNLIAGESIEDTAYRLHNIGYNWQQIAELYGWYETMSEPGETKHMFKNEHTGERASVAKAVGQYKLAYQHAIKARKEAPLRIQPNATETFRRSAAQGYISRINRRLYDVASGRHSEDGAALVLRGREDDLSAFFKKENPDMFRPAEPEPPCEACNNSKSGYCRRHRPLKYVPRPHSEAGYSAGVRHADTANLNPSASNPKTKELS
jgi:hypothetical protein